MDAFGSRVRIIFFWPKLKFLFSVFLNPFVSLITKIGQKRMKKNQLTPNNNLQKK